MDNLFKYTNGVNVISNQYIEDRVLEMQKTRWGRFQLWFNRVIKKHF